MRVPCVDIDRIGGKRVGKSGPSHALRCAARGDVSCDPVRTHHHTLDTHLRAHSLVLPNFEEAVHRLGVPVILARHLRGLVHVALLDRHLARAGERWFTPAGHVGPIVRHRVGVVSFCSLASDS